MLLDKMRGLALVPGDLNNQLISFDLDRPESKLVMYFNNPFEFPEVIALRWTHSPICISI